MLRIFLQACISFSSSSFTLRLTLLDEHFSFPEFGYLASGVLVHFWRFDLISEKHFGHAEYVDLAVYFPSGCLCIVIWSVKPDSAMATSEITGLPGQTIVPELVLDGSSSSFHGCKRGGIKEPTVEHEHWAWTFNYLLPLWRRSSEERALSMNLTVQPFLRFFNPSL